MPKRAHVIVTGHVQGVFFRAETEKMAQQLGVAGWVRNLPEGRVEAVFEGDHEAVDSAVAWVQHGPTRAHVTDAEVAEGPVEGLTGFSIRD